MRIPRLHSFTLAPLAAVGALALAGAAHASSHREAPFISGAPKVDASDFYLFNSYEAGRSDYVTLIADYQPLQSGYDGPNYHAMDPNALYEIHVDNNGDGKEDLTFQFRFKSTVANNGAGLTVPVGNVQQEIAPMQNGVVSMPNDPHLQVNESFTLTLVRGDRRGGTAAPVTNASGGASTFAKPFDNIGEKTIPDYAAYAAAHVYTINIPGCSGTGKVFVGQRQDPFAVNLGVVFDMVDAPVGALLDPGAIGATPSTLDEFNVTTLALEVPKSCLVAGNDPVIGAWTTASLRQTRVLDPAPRPGWQTTDRDGGAWTQVSRLGNPLVNELVIGLKDKDHFNASKPRDDAQFLSYVTNPSYPKLLESYLGAPGISPTNIPRNDLVTVFLTGIAGVNKPAAGSPAEELRLNTGIAAVPFDQQNRLGIVGNILAGGSDNAGFPNGRRPKDDIVDITLVAAMGGLCVANGTGNALGFGSDCNPSAVPLGTDVFKLNDNVDQAARPLLAAFPYLNTPVPGTGARAAASAAHRSSK